MDKKLIISFLIFIIFVISLPTYAQSQTNCGSGLTEDKITGQCIPLCGEGTIPSDTGGCVIEPEIIDLGQIEVIAGGIIVGVLATAFGIIWTIISRRSEIQKENLELIKSYGDKLSEIMQEEQNLETKLDCSLYAERYLDSLEQIASLLDKKLIRRDVPDYFKNHFKYGINLWYWYKENIEKIPKSLLETEFCKGVITWSEWAKTNKGTTNDFFEEKIESESDRWYNFRFWCCKKEDSGKLKEPYKKFEPISRRELVQKRLAKLPSKIPVSHIEEKQIEILNALDKLFSKETDDVDNKQIYNVIKNITKDEKDPELSPFVFIKRYSKKEQYDILPDTMQEDFDEIPDENGMSKFEAVETMQKFGEILNNITSKEKNLYSKLDCSLYAEQYLETLEQIATLYRKRVIPKKAADYFENKFAYGINLLDWYSKFVIDNDVEFDPFKDEIYKNEEKEDRWSDIKWFCSGGDLQKNKITKFKWKDEDLKVLPDVMYYYNDLPEEEGLEPSEILKIMRNYSKQLTELLGKETELKTKIDCSVYAEQYLDTLEQISYLFNKKAIATDAVTYFENNFAYGLTLKRWYGLAVIGANEQENRWVEIEEYCKNFKDEGEKSKPIKNFNIETTLPTSMLHYNELPTDMSQKEYDNTPNYKFESEKRNLSN